MRHGRGPGLEILKKDAYVIALAPAVVFSGVYAYEFGRYHHLRIPASFIDLSINRLLAGGAMIGLLMVSLLGLSAWAWLTAARNGASAKLGAGLLITSVFLTVPVVCWTTTVPHFIDMSKLLTVLSSVGTILVTWVQLWSARRWPLRTYRRATIRRQAWELVGAGLFIPIPFLNVIVALILLAWTATAFAGLGFFVERQSTDRLCLGADLVASARNDQLILKPFDVGTGVIAPTVKFVGIEGAELAPCSPKLVGGTGLDLSQM